MGILSYLMFSDEEYRLLRQNIFERLASGTPVPTEIPVIPLSSHSRSLYEGKSTKFILHLIWAERHSPHSLAAQPRTL